MNRNYYIANKNNGPCMMVFKTFCFCVKTDEDICGKYIRI